MNKFIFTLMLTVFSVSADEEKPLWEYGFGTGWVQFPHYPASDQISSRVIPFPTFQYRGERVRADDREGTKAYLLKNPIWSIELAGGGYPAAEADDNRARFGMRNLPWVLFLGPQLIIRLTESWQIRTAAFQVIATDFEYTAFSGAVFEPKLQYRWESELNDFTTSGFISFEARSGDKKFHSIYYEVSPYYSTPERPAYQPQAGLLSYEVSYFQSIKKERTAFYFGVSYALFSASVNRQSPLHRTDENKSFLLGFTYTLAESKMKAPEDHDESLLERIKD